MYNLITIKLCINNINAIYPLVVEALHWYMKCVSRNCLIFT